MAERAASEAGAGESRVFESHSYGHVPPSGINHHKRMVWYGGDEQEGQRRRGVSLGYTGGRSEPGAVNFPKRS
jgi:hypothetical protein